MCDSPRRDEGESKVSQNKENCAEIEAFLQGRFTRKGLSWTKVGKKFDSSYLERYSENRITHRNNFSYIQMSYSSLYSCTYPSSMTRRLSSELSVPNLCSPTRLASSRGYNLFPQVDCSPLPIVDRTECVSSVIQENKKSEEMGKELPYQGEGNKIRIKDINKQLLLAREENRRIKKELSQQMKANKKIKRRLSQATKKMEETQKNPCGEVKESENIKVEHIGHLGLVASVMRDVDLIGKVDKIIPLAERAKTTMGQRLAAMILNGLGFNKQGLYMYPKFLEDKGIRLLLGEDVKAEDFNDDSLGRCLDAIDEYGSSKFFSTIALMIKEEMKIPDGSYRVDTTSLSLYGEYDEPENPEHEELEANCDPSKGAVPKRGYAKNKRFDLKQMILLMTTTSAEGFPVWMEAHSGNKSDKKIMYKSAESLLERVKNTLNDKTEALIVADSAMFEACLKDKGISWLTRVPETHGEAKNILEKKDEYFAWKDLDEKYKIYSIPKEYKGVSQRWLVVFSRESHERECKTLERNIKKDQEESEKNINLLEKKTFGCKKDAEQAIKDVTKDMKYHIFSYDVVEIYKNEKLGRPKKDAEKKITGYKVKGQLKINEGKIEKEKEKKGRFILATNQLDKKSLPDEEILLEYKGLSKTERGFKFIKDNKFQVSSVYLKKPERICALMTVMTLCLLVYSVSQYKLRETLVSEEDTISDQKGKPTSNPTMRWAFEILYSISFVTIKTRKNVRTFISELTQDQKKIIHCFGKTAMEIYGLIPKSLSVGADFSTEST